MRKLMFIMLLFLCISGSVYAEEFEYCGVQSPGVYSSGSNIIKIVLWNYYFHGQQTTWNNYIKFTSDGSWSGPVYRQSKYYSNIGCQPGWDNPWNESDICTWLLTPDLPGRPVPDDDVLEWICSTVSSCADGSILNALNNAEWSSDPNSNDWVNLVNDRINADLGDVNTLPADAAFDREVNVSKGGDPVFMSNGEYGLSVTDLSIPGRVLPVEIVRTYGSKRDYNGRFGYGWDMNYNMKVRRLSSVAGDPNAIILLNGGGYRREYTQDATDPNLYIRTNDLSDHLDCNDTDNIVTLVKKSGIEYSFDPNGNLSSITDRNGNSITFTYNSGGLLPINGPSMYFYTELFGGPVGKYGLVAKEYQLDTITDDLGRDIDLVYDANGLLSTITDFDSRVWTYTYDSQTNDLLSVQDPNGDTITYGYYYAHNLKSITDAKGQEYITNHYNFSDVVDWQDYGDGTYTFDYNSVAGEAVITDRRDFITQIFYSDAGQVLSETIYTTDPNAEPNSFTTDYSYNANLELTTQILPADNCIYYTYNNLADVNAIYRKVSPGDPNTASDANVIAIAYTYDTTFVHDINSITDPMDNITDFEYDTKGNLEKITYPTVAVYGQSDQSPIVQYTYNTHGQVETVTAPDGIVTKYIYYDDSDNTDPNCGKLKQMVVDYNDIDGLKITTEYKYDMPGNVIEVIDPNGNSTKFTYNSLSNLTQITDPCDNVTKFGYDKNKKLTQTEKVRVSDPNQITGYSYDILDHLEQLTDPLGFNTLYSYNKNEDPNLITDAETNTTAKEYNERGLLIDVTDANNNSTKFTYTANGDINDVNDAASNKTVYTYDGFDRLVQITYPDDSNEIFGYDKNSNLTSKKNRNGQTIYYEYDALNRLEVKNRPGDPNITFAYDIASRVVNVNNASDSTDYAYDRIGRVDEVNDIESRLVSYEYDERSLRTKLTYPDDSNVTYEYDALSRLDKVKYNGSVIADYSYDELSRRTLATLGNDANAVYEYDLGNRLLILTNNIDDGNSIVFDYNDYDNVGNRLSCKIDDANAHDYEYDVLYQLITADYNDGNVVNYYYGKLGNRSSVNDGSSTSYSHNNLNQYTLVGGTSYSYDNNGNLADDNLYLYYYDCENRLIDVNDKSTGNPVGSYKYDYLGRRIEKVVDSNTTKYCYDGDQVIAEYENDTLVRKFIYGAGIDEPICMIDVTDSNSVYYYHFDGLGSVAALSDINNVILERYSYDVFGAPTITDANDNVISDSGYGNPYLFTGRRLDTETDNYYYRLRYYAPNIGRFLQTDPVRYADGLNMYTYVGNNPLNWIDPWGLWGDDGHSQLGYGRHGFDYTKLDHSWKTSPFNPFSTWRHFRHLGDINSDMLESVKKGDKEAFEKHAHEGQDYFSHYSKGYRWWKGGHAKDGHEPDKIQKHSDDFKQADQWTKDWEDLWDKYNKSKKESKK